MPNYTYKCFRCKHIWEKYVKFTDYEDRTCPECGNTEGRKVYEVPVVKYKGKGFYTTDVKEKDKKE